MTRSSSRNAAVRYFLPDRNPKWSWRAAIAAWITVACVMAVLFSAFSRGWINTLELARSGTRVTATVVKLELSNHGGCRYTYSVDAHTYTKSDSLCGVNRQIGDPLVVTYLPSNPAVSTTGSPGGNVRNALMIDLLVPTLLAFAVGRGVLRRRNPV